MSIERLNKEELTQKCIDYFYDYMANGTHFFVEDTYTGCLPEYPTPMDMLYKESMDTLTENANRIALFKKEIMQYSDNKELVDILNSQLKLLEEEREYLTKSNMEYQKELYKTTGKLDYARNIVRIPLDKVINSYYDDLVLEVVFYDNIGVLDGVYKDYKTCEDKIQFIKDNTEITHMGLIITSDNNMSRQVALIALMGATTTDSSLANQILSSKFADFENLTLADIDEIKNNDVRQFMQTKIDMDKEDLEVLASLDIRGDNYKILVNKRETENKYKLEDYYIRYICPSTGRVYYNSLDISNLERSNYFVEEDYESYAKAWWSINNLGASIEGKAIIRC